MFPQLTWDEFLTKFRWNQGEHLTAIGTTGAGKTTLILELMPLRKFVMFLATKRRDPLIEGLTKQGYRKMRTPQEWAERVVVLPPFPADISALKKVHRATFRNALTVAYRSGGWTVVADEVRYLTENLRLHEEMGLLWLQGRSLGVTIVAATQRPRNIPLEAYDQATHLFLWRDNDTYNLKRLSEISGNVDKQQIQRRLPELERHTMLYVNTRTDEIYETRVDIGG